MNPDDKTKLQALCLRLEIEARDSWTALWQLCETLGDDGATLRAKVDGERSRRERYSVIVSGGPIPHDEDWRRDGPNLEELLLEAIFKYDQRFWSGSKS